MQRTLRTFIAVEISSEVRNRARRLIAHLAESSAAVKWVEPHNLHLTLKFLGQVDMLDVPQICTALADAVIDIPPFDLHASGAGAFPTLERPRTVWLGVGEGDEAMIELHDAIDAQLAPLGFRSEARRFRPHLTIGRVRSTSDESIRELGKLLAEHRDFAGGSTDVSEVVLFSSAAGRDGPTYEPLSHAALGGS